MCILCGVRTPVKNDRLWPAVETFRKRPEILTIYHVISTSRRHPSLERTKRMPRPESTPESLPQAGGFERAHAITVAMC